MNVDVGARTHRGKVRSHNEDSLGVNYKSRIFIVADGMGGHAAGEIASNLLKDTIEEYLLDTKEKRETPEILKEAVFKANKVIYEQAREDKRKKGMGTTATILVIREGRYYIAQVGDSRAYLLRGRRFTQLTRDHSKVYQLYEKGLIKKEEINSHPLSNIITRSIGIRASVIPDIVTGECREGDRFLLCSDGLHGEVPEAEILETLKKKKAPQECVDALIEKALEHGGKDNITAIVVDVLQDRGDAAARKTTPISDVDTRKLRAVYEDTLRMRCAEQSGRSRIWDPRIAVGLLLALLVLAGAWISWRASEAGSLFILKVSTVPQDAEIYVDGEYKGKSPLRLKLPEGEYTFTILKTGYGRKDERIRLCGSRRERTLSFTLRPE